METSVGVVLYRRQNLNNMFLLLKYPAGHWDFAKGHKEAGETNKQTALRELHEETGIKNIIFLKGFEKRIFYSYRHAGRLMRKQVIFFMGRTIEKDVRLSMSTQRTRGWITKSRYKGSPSTTPKEYWAAPINFSKSGQDRLGGLCGIVGVQ